MDITEARRFQPYPDTQAKQGPASGSGGASVPSSPQAALPVSSSEAQSRSLSVSDSPCVAVCSTLYDEICRGCGRTAMEVANWVFLDEEEKRRVWERITAQGYPRRKG